MSGSLTTIIGAVGAGKSTLLQMMLNELPTSRGSAEVTGTMSYASQDSWLFVGELAITRIVLQEIKIWTIK